MQQWMKLYETIRQDMKLGSIDEMLISLISALFAITICTYLLYSVYSSILKSGERGLLGSRSLGTAFLHRSLTTNRSLALPVSAPNQVKSVKTERLRRLGVICSAVRSFAASWGEFSHYWFRLFPIAEISLWLPKFGHQIRELSFLDARSMLLSQNH